MPDKALANHIRALGDVPRVPDTYRGWTISYDPPPIPWRGADWRAIGPNYDAWTESGEWVDNGEKTEAPTYEALIAEIDAYLEEHDDG